MTITTPLRLITLHFSQRGLTDARTFMSTPLYLNNLFADNLRLYHNLSRFGKLSSLTISLGYCYNRVKNQAEFWFSTKI